MKKAGFGFRRALCFIAVMSMIFMAAASVSAQAKPKGKDAVRGWFRELKLTDEELKDISAVVEADEAEINKAQAEIRIVQSQIARLMLDSAPDIAAIGAGIDKSLESEKLIRMAQIKRQIEVRKILGKERWQTVLLLVKEARVSQTSGKFSDSFSKRGINPKDAAAWTKLLLMLRKIM